MSPTLLPLLLVTTASVGTITPIFPHAIIARSTPAPVMVLDHQFFELNLRGFDALCAQNPQGCTPAVQDSLLALHRRKTTAVGALLGGLAVLSGSVAIAMGGPSEDRGATIVGGGLVSAVLDVFALCLWPRQNDYLDVLNTYNAENPDAPASI